PLTKRNFELSDVFHSQLRHGIPLLEQLLGWPPLVCLLQIVLDEAEGKDSNPWTPCDVSRSQDLTGVKAACKPARNRGVSREFLLATCSKARRGKMKSVPTLTLDVTAFARMQS